jgi:hypothetical protein
MKALSSVDGSADAVRRAADAAALPSDDNRLALERELDRLNRGIYGGTTAMIQHLNWMLLSQAFLMVAYLIVLVGGWTVPLPGKRWLLTSIAGFGTVVMVLAYLGVRGSQDRLGPLRVSRRTIEEALERVAARPVVFSRQRVLVIVLAEWSTRVLPLLMFSGWLALALYTIAVPMPSDSRASPAASRGEARPAASQSTSPAKRASRPAPGKVEDPAPAPAAAVEPEAETESPLAGFLRRAINQPPAAEPQSDRVTP